MSEQLLKEIVAGLGAYLQANVPTIAQVLNEWPTANTTLKYPSISIITTGKTRFTPLMGTKVYQGPLLPNNTSVIRYVGGHIEANLQLDIWCATKAQRSSIVEEVVRALNVNPVTMGTRIQLTDYYNEWASYSLLDFEYKYDEAATQRQEWRCLLSIACSCNAIFEKTEYIILQAVLAEEPTATFTEEL